MARSLRSCAGHLARGLPALDALFRYLVRKSHGKEAVAAELKELRCRWEPESGKLAFWQLPVPYAPPM